ncbi:hypothetical protein LCGC14_2356270 [marine sediment metagenome]|uniref:Uncharacterized protein n=1 Tax=marine sediment metagenome TaxID=412755 RepID=A0A0F9C8A0_9ZZZZ
MSKKSQECGFCRYAERCFSEKTTSRNIVLNILACRIRKRLNINESTKLLLSMIRPKLLSLISNARQRVGSGYINNTNDECTKSELSSNLKMHLNTVKKYLNKLEELNIIQTKIISNKTLYFIEEY